MLTWLLVLALGAVLAINAIRVGKFIWPIVGGCAAMAIAFEARDALPLVVSAIEAKTLMDPQPSPRLLSLVLGLALLFGPWGGRSKR